MTIVNFTGLPQASHILSEAIHRVQTAQRTLILMRGIAEHPTPRQDGGVPPGAEEPLGSDDSEDGGSAKESTIGLDSDDVPGSDPGLYEAEEEDPPLAPSPGLFRPRNPAPGAKLGDPTSQYQGRGWGPHPEVPLVA